MSGIASVMARIGQIQSMATHASGGSGPTFEAALADAASRSNAAAATTSPATRTRTSGTGSADLPPDTLPTGAARWQASIERAARANGLDPTLLTALVWVESGFDPNAVSHAGAIGLAQLMPATAEGLKVDPYDPEQNLDGGARFLAAMVDRFGSTELGLAAYNVGPARVGSLLNDQPGVPVAEGYVNAVLDRYRQLGGTE